MNYKLMVIPITDKPVQVNAIVCDYIKYCDYKTLLYVPNYSFDIQLNGLSSLKLSNYNKEKGWSYTFCDYCVFLEKKFDSINDIMFIMKTYKENNKKSHFIYSSWNLNRKFILSDTKTRFFIPIPVDLRYILLA